MLLNQGRKMKHLFLYCRAGYEKECANEIQDKAAELDFFGFAKAQSNQGYVVFELYEEKAQELLEKLPVFDLIFARQMFVAYPLLEDLPQDDRISPIVALLEPSLKAGRLWVETPDTNEAKELSRFCRKFTVPLRKALREKGTLLEKEHKKKPTIHVCFVASGCAFVGYSLSSSHSPYSMGIPRLKMPSDAPSRSVLKLEEAFKHFIPHDEREVRLASGLKSVDLGACPGGWTYQLVRHGFFVSAVDHGAMDPALMETGQVKHFLEDGFKFEPARKNIYWLVCDMVDKPARVAELIERWAVEGWFTESIFNLKLPMKSRYKEVKQVLETMTQVLHTYGLANFKVACKHLYHDRDEVTVHLDLRPTKL